MERRAGAVRVVVIILVLFALAGASSPLFAGEGLFSRVYTTETVPGGHFELEQLARNRAQRSFQTYSAYDFRSEFEYGITDNFQGALYVNYGAIHAKGSPDDDDPSGATGFSRSQSYLQGFSAELIYRLTSPVTEPLGVAFYVEPEIAFYDPHNGMKYSNTFGTEYRLLLQKNLFDDQVILALNTILELEFIRFDGQQDWKGEIDWNNELGASYRIGSGWYAGLELRNHNEFGNFDTHEHSVYWAGPAVHYATIRLWATLGVLKQIYGVPNGVDRNGTFVGDNLFLRSHENWETTLKVGAPF